MLLPNHFSNSDFLRKLDQQYFIETAQVAHDLRSPLTALKIASNMEVQTDESRQLLKNAIERIEAITQKILTTWTHQQETKSVNEIDINVIAQTLIQEAQITAGHKVKIVYDSEKSEHKVDFNKGELQRVMMNLLSNSIRAIEHAANKTIRVSVRQYRKKTTITIQDEGCGISESLLTKLGSLGCSANKKNGGHGLGLHFVKNCIENAGGKLSILSKEHIGTTVVLTLPRRV